MTETMTRDKLPDLAARVAALEADMSLVRQILHIPNAETKAALAEAEATKPTFTTSRKPADPAPGVMTDAEIAKAAFAFGCKDTSDPFKQVVRACHEAIRLTRASIRAQLAANEAGALKEGAELIERSITPIEKAISAALKAHKEGV